MSILRFVQVRTLTCCYSALSMIIREYLSDQAFPCIRCPIFSSSQFALSGLVNFFDLVSCLDVFSLCFFFLVISDTYDRSDSSFFHSSQLIRYRLWYALRHQNIQPYHATMFNRMVVVSRHALYRLRHSLIRYHRTVPTDFVS